MAYPEPSNSRTEAAWRVIKHSPTLCEINPSGRDATDVAIRSALTVLLTGAAVQPTSKTKNGDGANASSVARALQYIKDRVSVPRDMPLWSAMRFRAACEIAAAAYGPERGPPVPLRNRYDQNPAAFAAARDGK